MARSGHTATLLANGTVLVAGGCSASGCTAVSELYNPTTNSWSTTGSLNTAPAGHTAVRLKTGKVLVIGGAGAPCELYDPATGTWSNGASTNVARAQHGATMLQDGKVLVTGGAIGRFPINSGELYDPASNTWTLTGNMRTGRYAHTSTLLPDGTVLVAGGEGQSISCGKDCVGFIPTASAEIFNEAAGGFASTTGLNLSSHSSTFTAIATSGDYGQSNNCPTTLNPGQNCAITVSFAPTAAGTRNGALTLRDNDPGSPRQAITLSGTGETTTLGLVPASLDFGGVTVGSSSVQSATLVNDGAAPVNITGIAFSPAKRIFSQSNNCPATLSVQQTCTFEITFKPPDVFTYSADLSITSSGGGAATLPLSGTGLDN